MLDLASYNESNKKYVENLKKDILSRNPQAVLVETVGTATNYQVKPNNSSSSRGYMAGTHMSQGVAIEVPELRHTFVGTEREYGKYVFNVKCMADCIVRRVTKRTENGNRSGAVLATYLTVEIIDGIDAGKLDIIELPKFIANDYYFGHDLQLTRDFNQGDRLRKGEILAGTRSVIDGEWCTGTHANTILSSHHGGIEDASIISERLAKKMNGYAFAKHRVYIGEKQFPLFLYGTKDEPRIFPAVGEKVRDDGVLMAVREVDKMMGSISTTRTALSEANSRYDKCFYTDATAEVVDIKVYKAKLDSNKRNLTDNPIMAYSDKMYTPVGVQGVCDKAADSLKSFYSDLRKTYLSLQNENRRHDMELTHSANALLFQAIAYDPLSYMNEVRQIRNRKPENLKHVLKRYGLSDNIDDYMIEITVRFPIPVSVSTKMTELMGGKGEVAQVVKDHLMPRGTNGEQVDLIMSENALLRRTNYNRTYEHFLNAARRDVQKKAQKMYNDGDVDGAFDTYIDYFNCFNDRWAKAVLETHTTREQIIGLLDELNEVPLRQWDTIDCVITPDEAIRNIIERHCPESTPLILTKEDGTTEETVNKFLIGDLYIVRLNKTGREFSAMAAAKFQPHGTIANPPSSEKYSRPIKVKGIRVLGQSECRHLAAYIDDTFPADIKDKSNNPVVQSEMIWNILNADDVMNIEEVIDREKFPLGNNRELAANNHVMACAGIAWTTNIND